MFMVYKFYKEKCIFIFILKYFFYFLCKVSVYSYLEVNMIYSFKQCVDLLKFLVNINGYKKNFNQIYVRVRFLYKNRMYFFLFIFIFIIIIIIYCIKYVYNNLQNNVFEIF